jgi:hypothetical protein
MATYNINDVTSQNGALFSGGTALGPRDVLQAFNQTPASEGVAASSELYGQAPLWSLNQDSFNKLLPGVPQNPGDGSWGFMGIGASSDPFASSRNLFADVGDSYSKQVDPFLEFTNTGQNRNALYGAYMGDFARKSPIPDLASWTQGELAPSSELVGPISMKSAETAQQILKQLYPNISQADMDKAAYAAYQKGDKYYAGTSAPSEVNTDTYYYGHGPMPVVTAIAKQLGMTPEIDKAIMSHWSDTAAPFADARHQAKAQLRAEDGQGFLGGLGGLGGVLGLAAMVGKFVPGPWTPLAYGYSALQALDSKDPFKLAGAALGAFGGDLFGDGDMNFDFNSMSDFGDGVGFSLSDPSSFDFSQMSDFGDGAGFSGDPQALGDAGGYGYSPEAGGGDSFSNGAWSNSWGEQATQLFDQAGMPGYTQYGATYGDALMDKIGGAFQSPLDAAKGGMSIASGLYGMNRARQIEEYARKAGKKADPWGNSGGRALADSQLQELMRNPGQVSSRDPSYALRMQGAQRANVTRGSGAMAVAGANASTDWYNQRMQALGGMAGAPGDPTAPGKIDATAYGMGNDLAGQSLASIGYGMSRLGGVGQDMPPEVQQWLLRQSMGARA